VFLVSGLDFSDQNIQQNEYGNVAVDQSVHIALALTNTGNAPSSLLKVFLIVPKASTGFDCSNAKNIDWVFLSSLAFGSKDFQGAAFTMNPIVVAPLGIAALDANIPS
jgi:hypothetical protein